MKAKSRQTVILLAGVECTKGKEKEFNDWYNSTLPPLMMKVPGVVRVDRYERLDDDNQYPTFVSIVELEDEAAIESMAKSEAIKELSRIFVEQGARWNTQVRWGVHYRRIFSSEG